MWGQLKLRLFFSHHKCNRCNLKNSSFACTDLGIVTSKCVFACSITYFIYANIYETVCLSHSYLWNVIRIKQTFCQESNCACPKEEINLTFCHFVQVQYFLISLSLRERFPDGITLQFVSLYTYSILYT